MKPYNTPEKPKTLENSQNPHQKKNASIQSNP